jgi:hypothetical protein
LGCVESFFGVFPVKRILVRKRLKAGERPTEGLEGRTSKTHTGPEKELFHQPEQISS